MEKWERITYVISLPIDRIARMWMLNEQVRIQYNIITYITRYREKNSI